MPTYRFLHYDVFTDRALEGNQLAVFPGPAGLSTGMMQAITREMNFSECKFVFGLGVGPTPVSLEWKGGALDFAWMTQKNPTFGTRIADLASFAAALGL